MHTRIICRTTKSKKHKQGKLQLRLYTKRKSATTQFMSVKILISSIAIMNVKEGRLSLTYCIAVAYTNWHPYVLCVESQMRRAPDMRHGNLIRCPISSLRPGGKLKKIVTSPPIWACRYSGIFETRSIYSWIDFFHYTYLLQPTSGG